MKNLTKKQKITYVVITIIILAIIGTIIGVTTHKAKKPELIECKATEQQVEKKVVRKAVPKGQGKVVGTTDTKKMNTPKPNTTKPNTTKPNNPTHEHFYYIPVWKTTEIPVYGQRTVYVLVWNKQKFYSKKELDAYIYANIDTHPGYCQYQEQQESYQIGTRTEKYIDHYKCDCGATSYDHS